MLRRNRIVCQPSRFTRLPTSALHVFITWLLRLLPTLVLRKLPRVLSAMLLRVVILDRTPDL
jgi:hypothetical protein